MFTIKNVATQQVFRGRSISSIARNVWGRDVVVWPESEVKGLYQVMSPPIPSNPNARLILAVVWADEDVPFDIKTVES